MFYKFDFNILFLFFFFFSHSYTGQDYSTQGNAGKISLDQIDSVSISSC